MFGRRRTFPSEHFFCVLAAGASSPRNTFFASWRRAHLPFGTLFLRPGGAAVGFAPRSGLWEGAGRRSTGHAPPLPPGGRPVPSAPLNSPSRPYPAPLNTLAPPPPAPQNPRLFRPRPAPGPTAERAGPAPAPPQNPLHRPRPAPLNTLAPPPGSTAEPPARPRPAPLNTLALSRLGPRKPPPKGRNTPPKALFGAICRKVAPGVGYFVEYFVPLDANGCKKCLLQPIT